MTAGQGHRYIAHRYLAPIAIAVIVLIGMWSTPARGAAIITTGAGSNEILIYPSPNPQLPDADGRPRVRPSRRRATAGRELLRRYVSRRRQRALPYLRGPGVDGVPRVNDRHLERRYSGGGTLVVNPQQTHALAVDPFFFIGLLTVIAAPFTPGATITQLPLTGVADGRHPIDRDRVRP